MIGYIILGMWLVPFVISIPTVIIIAMIHDGSFFPFDDWYDIPILIVCLAIWPVLLGLFIKNYRQERKIKLTTVQKTIDVHYKDKWYD